MEVFYTFMFNLIIQKNNNNTMRTIAARNNIILMEEKLSLHNAKTILYQDRIRLSRKRAQYILR